MLAQQGAKPSPTQVRQALTSTTFTVEFESEIAAKQASGEMAPM